MPSGDLELEVTVAYHFRVAIYYEYDYNYFTWNGSSWVLAGSVTGLSGEIFLDTVHPKCRQTSGLLCTDCSPDYYVLTCQNYSVYKDTFTLADCSQFWDEFTLPKVQDVTNDCIVNQNGTGIDSCFIAIQFISTSGGANCVALLYPNLTIPGVNCPDTEAYVDFTEV